MNVSLTPFFEEKINQDVASGLYSNASEVIREALRKYYQSPEKQQSPMAQAVQKGIDQLNAGMGIKMTLPQLRKEVRNYSKQKTSIKK